MAKNAVLKRLLKRLPKSSHAPVEAPELELVDTLEDAAALGSDASSVRLDVDPTTGEIIDAPEPAPAPTPIRPDLGPSLPPVLAPAAADAPDAPPPNDDEAPF